MIFRQERERFVCLFCFGRKTKQNKRIPDKMINMCFFVCFNLNLFILDAMMMRNFSKRKLSAIHIDDINIEKKLIEFFFFVKNCDISHDLFVCLFVCSHLTSLSLSLSPTDQPTIKKKNDKTKFQR